MNKIPKILKSALDEAYQHGILQGERRISYPNLGLAAELNDTDFELLFREYNLRYNAIGVCVKYIENLEKYKW